jgi:Tfp pilus assembly protein PilN
MSAMYKINIYPEYAERVTNSKLRRVRSGTLMALVAVEVLVVSALLISGFLLAEQAQNANESVARLQEQIAAGPSQSDELAAARAMVSLRRNRLDWSPKLAALSSAIDPSLAMAKVSGEISPKKTHRLVLDGRVKKGKPSMETVSGLLEALRGDERVSGDFEFVTLGNIRGGDSEEFQVICSTKEAKGGKK